MREGMTLRFCADAGSAGRRSAWSSRATPRQPGQFSASGRRLALRRQLPTRGAHVRAAAVTLVRHGASLAHDVAEAPLHDVVDATEGVARVIVDAVVRDDADAR